MLFSYGDEKYYKVYSLTRAFNPQNNGKFSVVDGTARTGNETISVSESGKLHSPKR
jgi:hypothetical protein